MRREFSAGGVLVRRLRGGPVCAAINPQGTRMVVLAFAGALLVGVADELHQATLPGRQAGWDDLAADAIGALIGAALLRWRQIRKQAARA